MENEAKSLRGQGRKRIGGDRHDGQRVENMERRRARGEGEVNGEGLDTGRGAWTGSEKEERKHDEDIAVLNTPKILI
jgi:hypothetical protein